MPEILIAGIPVNFPFPPYDVQVAYMEKLIMCLENCSNGVLESPTGTGKTLSLLCASLAWLLYKKNQVAIYSQDLGPIPKEMLGEKKSRALLTPKIIYASRTHSQLTQAMQELKNCSYSFMKAIVLGSRDQLCIHPEVMKETTNTGKVQLCKIKVTTRTCRFHRNVEKFRDRFKDEGVLDIEDLVAVGKKHVVCPYFMSRELVDNADIIFMPYNYLLDPKSSRSNNIDITNSIIILDEAHNIEKICEDSASIQIKSSDIASCINDVTHVMKIFSNSESGFDSSDMPKDFSIDELALLKEIFLDLEKAIDGIELTQSDKNFPGGYMYDLLAKGTITTANYACVAKLLDSLVQYIATISESSGFTPKGGSLQTFSDLLLILYGETTSDYFEKINKCFKVHVQAEQSKTTNKDTGGWISSSKSPNAKTISLWCFNPGFGMNRLLHKDVRSIILTSGTLSPLKPYIMELGIPVLHQLESPHIINESQVFVRVVPYGSDKGLLNSSYEHRTKTTYIASLGSTICSLAKSIPYGMLIFFPSYSVLLNCQENWQSSGIWNHISKIKPIYVEPRFKDAFLNTMQEYYDKINDPVCRGAIFMAVCRGKVSEGLDFADNNGRAVLITGIPFPPLMDPRVMLKKKYLQEIKTRENNTLNPDEWYTLEASRAVNQAIGRVIRHKNDYGAILLCDSRFSNPLFKQKLSKWLQCHLNKPQNANTNFGSVIRDLTLFFRNAERNLPLSVLKRETRIDLKDLPSSSNMSMNESEWNPVDQNSSMVFKPITSKPYDSGFSLTNAKSLQSAESSTKRQNDESDSSQTVNANRKKKYKLLKIPDIKETDNKPVQVSLPTNRRDVLALAKDLIPKESYVDLLKCLKMYLGDSDFPTFFAALAKIFDDVEVFYLLEAMHFFVKSEHKDSFTTSYVKLSKIKGAAM